MGRRKLTLYVLAYEVAAGTTCLTRGALYTAGATCLTIGDAYTGAAMLLTTAPPYP